MSALNSKNGDRCCPEVSQERSLSDIRIHSVVES